MTKQVSVTVTGTAGELLTLFAFLAESAYDGVPKTGGLVAGQAVTVPSVTVTGEIEPVQSMKDFNITVALTDAEALARAGATPLGDIDLDAAEKAMKAEKAEAKKAADRARKKAARERKKAEKGAKVAAAVKASPAVEEIMASGLPGPQATTDDLLGDDTLAQTVTIPLNAMKLAVRDAVLRNGEGELEKEYQRRAVRALFETYGAKLLNEVDPSDYAKLRDELGAL